MLNLPGIRFAKVDMVKTEEISSIPSNSSDFIKQGCWRLLSLTSRELIGLTCREPAFGIREIYLATIHWFRDIAVSEHDFAICKPVMPVHKTDAPFVVILCQKSRGLLK